MTIAETLLAEFDQEMATTRKLLARVPGDKADWKPHPKSFSLAHLAQLVSRMPGWLTGTMTAAEMDLSKFAGYSNEKTETLVAEFDRNVSNARQAIASAQDSDFMAPWSLRNGPKVFFTLPRSVVMRQNINHLVHHRGQLTVYLRLLNVPIPSIYGPTADEKW